jgi:hypothetical protein
MYFYLSPQESLHLKIKQKALVNFPLSPMIDATLLVTTALAHGSHSKVAPPVSAVESRAGHLPATYPLTGS